MRLPDFGSPSAALRGDAGVRLPGFLDVPLPPGGRVPDWGDYDNRFCASLCIGSKRS